MEEYVYTKDRLKDIDVHTVLPQQEPFVMIGSLTHFEMGTSTTETLIKEDNIFVNNGCFSASGMMENIAQTCAARIGFYNKYILHKDVQVGFIGAVRDFRIYALAPVGTVITTQVDVVEEIFGMTLARATITASGITTTEPVNLREHNPEFPAHGNSQAPASPEAGSRAPASSEAGSRASVLLAEAGNQASVLLAEAEIKLSVRNIE